MTTNTTLINTALTNSNNAFSVLVFFCVYSFSNFLKNSLNKLSKLLSSFNQALMFNTSQMLKRRLLNIKL
jgi:hypothetical protein